MPEGDTVWLAGRRLHAALAGQVLHASRLPGAARSPPPTWPGETVLEVVPRGKHLLTRLGPDESH